jgi:hypothetical protein
MSDGRETQERPASNRMMIELIDDFFAEHCAMAGFDKVRT